MATSKKRRGCGEASIIGNFTVNIFVSRDEKSQIFAVKRDNHVASSRCSYALSQLVRSAVKGKSLVDESRLKSKSESNAKTSIGREKRLDVQRSGAGLLEKKNLCVI